MPVSFVIETLSCELALANSSSKISGNLVSGPLLVRLTHLGAFVLAKQVLIAGLDTRCTPD